jgi:putative transposase
MRLRKNKHSVHSIGYHIIFCPKYRHQVLTGLIEIEAKKIFAEICADKDWLLLSMEIMPDHVHLFIQSDPYTAPVEIVERIKSISAVYLFTRFSNLKKQKFWGSGLWSPSTYYGTVGTISEEAVRKYIEEQKKKWK